MNSNKLNSEHINSNLLNPKLLNSLTAENQKIAIDAAKECYNREKDGGILGRFLGTNKINVSIILSCF